MQTTRQLFWDRRTMALTGALWVILFAGAWLLAHGSSTPTPSGALAGNSGLSNAARASSPGLTLPGVTTVPRAPALAASAHAAVHRVRHVIAHTTAATTVASSPVRSVVVTPVTPARSSATIVPTTPVVSHPTTPSSIPTHTTPPPPSTHTSPPPSGGTGTVSGGG